MIKDTDNKYISCVKHFYDKDVKITKPEVAGKTHPVYIAETDAEKTVFRFSSRDCAVANSSNSALLNDYGVPVPQIHIYRINGEYCEVYPLVNGKTLFEKISNEQITKEQLYRVFQQMVGFSSKIACIPFKNYNHFCHMNPQVLKAHYMFQLFQPMPLQLSHTDFNMQNTILDENNNIIALLDLDGVTPAHYNTMFGRICLCAKQAGLDVNKICSWYPQVQREDSCVLLGIKPQMKLYCFLMESYTKALKKKQNLENKVHIR